MCIYNNLMERPHCISWRDSYQNITKSDSFDNDDGNRDNNNNY